MTTIFSNADGLYTDRYCVNDATKIMFDGDKFIGFPYLGMVGAVSGALPTKAYTPLSKGMAVLFGHYGDFEDVLEDAPYVTLLGYGEKGLKAGASMLIGLAIANYLTKEHNASLLLYSKKYALTITRDTLHSISEVLPCHDLTNKMMPSDMHFAIGSGGDYALTAMSMGIPPSKIFEKISRLPYLTGSKFGFISKKHLLEDISVHGVVNILKEICVSLHLKDNKKINKDLVLLFFTASYLYVAYLMQKANYMYARQKPIKKITPATKAKLFEKAIDVVRPITEALSTESVFCDVRDNFIQWIESNSEAFYNRTNKYVQKDQAK